MRIASGSSRSAPAALGRRSVRALVALVVAGVFAAAWRHELYLIVVALPAGALVVWAHERLTDLADARRVAALAITAPTGPTDGIAVERIVAADLAALSLGDLATVDEAIAFAERSIADPWRRSLSCERLEAAKRVVAESAFAPPARWAWLVARPVLRIVAGAVLAGTLVGISVWQHRALLVPLALALAAFSITLQSRRRSKQLPELLASESATAPARGTVLVPDDAVISAIAGLTRDRPRVGRVAARLVAASAEPEREVAGRRMATPASAPRLSRLDRDLLTVIAVAAVLVAVVEAM